MKKSKLVYILFIFLIKCSEKKELEGYITDGDFKYWQLVSDSAKHLNHQTFYYFDKKGKWLVFRRNRFSEFKYLDRGDVYLLERWKLLNDKRVEIGGDTFNIKASDNDILIISDISKNKTITLKAANDSVVPASFRKIQ